MIERRQAKDDHRAGFSVIEALVVLMIAGAALLLVFQIGVQGAQTSFRLGRRALTAADGEPGADSLRALVRGVVLGDRRTTPSGGLRGFTAWTVPDRATLCGPAGPAGRLRLTLTATETGDLLTCQAEQGEPRVLMDLRRTRGRFSYSDDGAIWRAELRPDAGRQRLQVRLSTDDGVVDIVEQAAPASLAQSPPAPPPEDAR